MQTLKNIPMIHILGITAIDLKDIQETEYTSNQRKCKATATLSNDTTHTVSYTLSKQENSIYLQLQLID